MNSVISNHTGDHQVSSLAEVALPGEMKQNLLWLWGKLTELRKGRTGMQGFFCFTYQDLTSRAAVLPGKLTKRTKISSNMEGILRIYNYRCFSK